MAVLTAQGFVVGAEQAAKLKRDVPNIPVTTPRAEIIKACGFVLDRYTRMIAVESDPRRVVDLGHKTQLFRLIELLMANAPRAVSRKDILARAWGINHDPMTNGVTVAVNYLRSELGKSAIVTVNGFGYRMGCTSSIEGR